MAKKRTTKKRTAKKPSTLVQIARDMSSIVTMVLGLKDTVQEIAEHVGLVPKLPVSDLEKTIVEPVKTEATTQTLQS